MHGLLIKNGAGVQAGVDPMHGDPLRSVGRPTPEVWVRAPIPRQKRYMDVDGLAVKSFQGFL